MRTPRRTSLILATAAVSIAALSLRHLSGVPHLIYYNPSLSAPLGWYVMVPLTDTKPGQWVLMNLPPDAAQLADERHYLPRAIPALKQIAAHDSDVVCEFDGNVRINKRLVAKALTHDLSARPLHPWSGCRALRPDEIFVLNIGHPASFDSRYYGPTTRTAVIGRAIPVWTENAQ